MHIAIIGTGVVGVSIARGLKGKGHSVVLGTRDPHAADIMSTAAAADAGLAKPDEAAAGADIIILALPWAAAEQATKALGDLSGKIVIDCMNPLGMVNGALGLTIGHNTSVGEIVQGWLGSARVVKTLNQVGAEMMANNRGLPHRPVMFMAGNDEAAKAAVAKLLVDLGFDPLDAGDITRSRLLEPFAMVWINQALLRGKGRKWALAAITSKENNDE